MTVARHMADRWQEWELSPYNARTKVKGTHVSCDPPRTKVCIYGAGLGKEQAPLDDPAWCIWGLNLVAPGDGQHRFRADVWWDLHQRKAQSPDDLRWLAACPFPLYVPPDLMDVSPRSVRYPLEEIEATIGGYFACTFAYQIALVLYENYVAEETMWTDLGLYGVELAFGTERERTVEWACVAYWVGRAEESGLRLHLPAHSSIGSHPFRYGFEYTEEMDAVNDYVDTMKRSRHGHDAAGTQEPEDDPRA